MMAIIMAWIRCDILLKLGQISVPYLSGPHRDFHNVHDPKCSETVVGPLNVKSQDADKTIGIPSQ